jgi:hypothetical protein
MTDEETITIEGYEVEDWTTASKRMFNHGHDGVYLPTSMIDEGRITIQDNGDVTMPLWLAESEGLVSGGTRVGIPLKRQRMPDMPEMMSDDELDDIIERCPTLDGWGRQGDAIWWGEHLVAIAEHNSLQVDRFFEHAPSDVLRLADENKRLRAWAAEAQKRAERKGTRRG